MRVATARSNRAETARINILRARSSLNTCVTAVIAACHPIDEMKIYSLEIQGAAIDALFRPRIYKTETRISETFNLHDLLKNIRPTDIMPSPASFKNIGSAVFPGIIQSVELREATHFVEDVTKIETLTYSERLSLLIRVAIHHFDSFTQDGRAFTLGMERLTESELNKCRQAVTDLPILLEKIIRVLQKDARMDPTLFRYMVHTAKGKVQKIQDTNNDNLEIRNKLKDICKTMQKEKVCAKSGDLIEQHILSRRRLAQQYDDLLSHFKAIDTFTRQIHRLPSMRDVPTETCTSLGDYWDFITCIDFSASIEAFQRTIDILQSILATKNDPAAALIENDLRRSWDATFADLERIPVAARTPNQQKLYAQMESVGGDTFKRIITEGELMFADFVSSMPHLQKTTAAYSILACELEQLGELINQVLIYRMWEGYNLFIQWPAVAKTAIEQINRDGKISDELREQIAKLLLISVSPPQFHQDSELNLLRDLAVYTFINIDTLVTSQPCIFQRVLAAADSLWPSDKDLALRARFKKLRSKFECAEPVVTA